jgi:hypothetical protein
LLNAFRTPHPKRPEQAVKFKNSPEGKYKGSFKGHEDRFKCTAK